MSTLYELYSKRTKYRNLRENVTNAINVLSRNSINDGLSTAKYVLGSSYVVNDISSKNIDIENIQESLATDLDNLSLCLSTINTKLNSINREIIMKESEGSDV